MVTELVEVFTPSQLGQFYGESGLWIDLVLPSAQEAFSQYQCIFSPFALTRNQVN
jgi:hypothetical protein